MDKRTLESIANDTSINPFHLMTLGWCSMLMLFDGYDLVIYGSVLPHLMSDWKLSPVLAGVIGSSALFGMMVGALTLGTSSDSFGRRRVILACLMVFGVAALFNGFCQNPTQFVVCRFLTGVGLGGMVPNVVALMTETSPGSKRNIMITVMLSFYSVGGVIAALMGKVITPEFGWRANFFIAGLPLLALPLLHRCLPESLAFLISQTRHAEADLILRKFAPRFPGDSRSIASATPRSKSVSKYRVGAVFTKGRAANTFLLWIAFGMCMLVVYGLSTWLPKMMTQNGYPIGSSLTFLLVLNAGAVLGGLISGWLADRWGGKATLITFFCLAAVSVGFLGYRQSPAVLNTLLLVAGATTIGGLGIVHAYAAQLYPSDIRSTGVGWAAAAGRFGAVAGPTLGGYLVGQKYPISLNFLAFAIPGLLAAIAIMLTKSERERAVDETPRPVMSVE